MNIHLRNKLTALFLVLGLLSTSSAIAQLTEIQNFLNAGSDNANALTQAYLSPLPTGLSTTLNSGWTTKAAPTKTLGFSVQVRAAVAAVPSSAQTFDAGQIGLTGGATASAGLSNTISGDNAAGQTISDGSGNLNFDVPGGTGLAYVPTAMLQANVGLIKSTDVTFRYIPETGLGDYGDVSLLGVGIKHGLNQWIPGGKLLPVDISVLAAFSQVNLNADLNFGANASGQRVETTTEAFVFNALVGKTLPFISAYAGLGFQTGNFELNMLGDYDLGGGNTLTNPVSYTQSSDANVHALAGVQLKIAVLRIFAEVTAAEFVTYNAGIGIGLRN